MSRLADVYPGSLHVSDVSLDAATDRVVWDYARRHGYIIVTKDVDFSEMSLLAGFPPKVLWIRRGNCSTSALEQLLRMQYVAIKALSEDAHTGILTLF